MKKFLAMIDVTWAREISSFMDAAAVATAAGLVRTSDANGATRWDFRCGLVRVETRCGSGLKATRAFAKGEALLGIPMHAKFASSRDPGGRGVVDGH